MSKDATRLSTQRVELSNSISSGVGDGSGITDGESVRPKGEGVDAERWWKNPATALS